MANILVPDDGKVYMVEKLINAMAPYYHLFTNDYTPTHDSHKVDFTEAVFSGYAAQSSPSWGPSFLDPAVPRGVIEGTAITWTKSGVTGEANIYGYYVTDGIAGDLLWAVRFDLTRSMLVDGEKIVVAPELDMLSIFGNS